MNQVQLPARFQNRQNRRQIVQAVTQGLGMASPPYISIKGGSFTLVDANGEQEPVETKWLDCVIIDTNVPSRVFWGDKKYDPNATTYESPVCFSDNGIGASASAVQPQSTSCQTCAQNVWGSATSKITGKPTKACQVMKKVAIVPVEGKIGPDGQTYVADFIQDFPFLLRTPVMSHENLRAYSAKFGGQDFDVSEVVTRVTFVHGQVGQLDFAAAGFTDEATEAQVQKFLDAKLTDALVGRGDQVWGGEARQIAPRTAETVARIEPPLASAQPAASQGPAATGSAPFATGQAAEAPKRTRRTKAQMEAAEQAQRIPDAPGFAVRPGVPQSAPPAADSQGGIPPFLQRTTQGAGAPFGQAPMAAPQHGIQQNPSAPNPELEATLANVFGLPTK